ncbi:MAG TPA: hypothetical protein PKC54_08925 [Ferruginibacter sp.]|nr:hypothetical protein [Ferruginibacter sp.]
MNTSKRYIILLLFFIAARSLQAQKNITGTWEGDLNGFQFLQLNIIQNGDQLCGYTWDYVKNDQRSFCKAYFQGTYDRLLKRYFLTGTGFIANSGDHFLMQLDLALRVENGEPILVEQPTRFALALAKLTGDSSNLQYVRLRKVAPQPQMVLEGMKDCLPKKKSPKKEIKDTIVKKQPVPVPDSTRIIPPPVITKKDSTPVLKDTASIPKAFTNRKNKEQSHLEVNVKTITLNVYDNAVIDGDTVSIFYNGKLLLSHQRLSEKPIVINLELDEKQVRHEITLFAENLGGIPPNTALVVVYAGNKRYELFSSASLEENAVLVFDYKPK